VTVKRPKQYVPFQNGSRIFGVILLQNTSHFTETAYNSPSRARTYNLAVNPGAPGLALPIEQVISYPLGRFHTFDLPLALHGMPPGRESLFPNKLPGTVLGAVLAGCRRGIIVLRQTPFKVVG
jgi:hypothetical protein